MKIVSLLPSATEIVFALGLGDALEGVTSDCDHPPGARSKPTVSTTALPLGARHSAGTIDQAVRTRIAAGEPIYRLDAARISDIAPDLIITQDLCRVCAVPTGHVEEALGMLGCHAHVISLDPSTLEDVIACIELVGDATGTGGRARELTGRLRDRIGAVREAVRGLDRPRTFGLEWADPPFTAGHWVPDMIEAAGSTPVLAVPGMPSRRVRWQEVAWEAPEVMVFMPCGYDLDQAVAESKVLLDVPALAATPRTFAADGSAYFSRPGPRVVDGIEALAWALHPDSAPTPRPEAIQAIRP
ncbi:MAG TPA: cobalamin-binding protein [Actinomycetota bacterium]|jgi:iron complex transport system substrate-binding protein